MPGSHVPDRGDYDLALFLNYQRSPLQFTSRGDTNSVVRDRLGGVIVGQLGLGHSLALTLSTPLVLYQYGDAASLADGGPSLATAAFADPSAELRWRVFGENSKLQTDRPEGLGLALSTRVTAPVGRGEAFANEQSATVVSSALLDFHLLGLGVGLSIGWKHRFEVLELAGVRFRDELQLGFGLKVPIPAVPGLDAHLGVQGSFDAGFEFEHEARTYFEAMAGLDYVFDAFRLRSTVGRGLSDGVGSPDVRAVLGFVWSPRVRDLDGDGVPDERDICAHLAEDKDGFEDADGCPDPDNDSDFVPDSEDRCPSDAAEEDRDVDEDGCTDEEPSPEAAVEEVRTVRAPDEVRFSDAISSAQSRDRVSLSDVSSHRAIGNRCRFSTPPY
ncbi:MAG: hypothetical protein AAF355_10155 [Myxococcota bacterium]